jgi:hypothetical protein
MIADKKEQGTYPSSPIIPLPNLFQTALPVALEIHRL